MGQGGEPATDRLVQLRGALNKIIALLEGGGVSRVVAASAGNHGLAVAYATRALGLGCTVYLPRSTSSIRLGAIRAHGAETVLTEGDVLDAEMAAQAAADYHGLAYISPYDDLDVIAGQGTIGIELGEQLAAVPDAIFLAVGGGGLLTGVAAAIRARWPTCRIVGCWPAASPVLARSLQQGRIVQMPIGSTLAASTAGGVHPGTVTFPLCQALVDDIVLVAEAEISTALVDCLLTEKLLIEGAAAVALAACRKHPLRRPGARFVPVLCGGNIDAHALTRLITQHRG